MLRKRGTGTLAQTAASGLAGSIASASTRRSDPDGRKTAVPDTITRCPKRPASCSAATSSAIPLTAFSSSSNRVNILSLCRIVSRDPETRIRLGSGVLRIRWSTAVIDFRSTMSCPRSTPLSVNSTDEKPTASRWSNLRKVARSAWSNRSESARPSVAARSACSMTSNAESPVSTDSKSCCC